jgi:hypothetical protein
VDYITPPVVVSKGRIIDLKSIPCIYEVGYNVDDNEVVINLVNGTTVWVGEKDSQASILGYLLATMATDISTTDIEVFLSAYATDLATKVKEIASKLYCDAMQKHMQKHSEFHGRMDYIKTEDIKPEEKEKEKEN